MLAIPMLVQAWWPIGDCPFARPMDLPFGHQIMEHGVILLAWDFRSCESVYILRTRRGVIGMEPKHKMAVWELKQKKGF